MAVAQTAQTASQMQLQLHPPAVAEGQASSSTSAQHVPVLDTTLLTHIKSLGFSFVISDAQHPDMPIVYASDNFYSLTGYTTEEVGWSLGGRRMGSGWPPRVHNSPKRLKHPQPSHHLTMSRLCC